MNTGSFVSSLTFSQEILFIDFQQRHEVLKDQNAVWSLAATRRRLISSFWLKNVLLDNYFIIVIAGTFVAWLFHLRQPVESLLVAALPAYFLVFALLFLSMYLPIYHQDFLPQVDNWMEAYQGNQMQEIQTCKKQQHSAVALMLIEVTDRQVAGMTDLINDTGTDLILARKYGISTKSVNSALNLITRATWDRKSIRKRTEIQDDFDAARDHFKGLSTEKAALLLDRLQQKLLQEPGK